MLKFNSKKRSLGIGLLELMLSLAIIAVLLIMATRYYSSASNSQKITAATGMINAIKAAAASYLSGYPAGVTSLTLTTLVNGGYLPSTFISGSNGSGATTNPWGNSISISKITPQNITISVTTPDNGVCQQLQQQVISSSTAVGTAGTAIGCSGAALSATFPIGG